MPRINIRESDPDRYATVKAEQESLKKACSGTMMARLCPYCGHRVETLYRGQHGPSSTKCPNCSEEVIFPAVCFRIA